MAVLVWVLMLLAVALTSATPFQVFYAGYNHIIAVDSESMAATAFDYRRHTPEKSTCDLIAQPPLLADVPLKDWISESKRKLSDGKNTKFTYVGHETFVLVDTKTGSWVSRKCKDFRPQLTALPCEAVGTGNWEQLKAPFKIEFVGNNRVIVFNPHTAEFQVRPFDTDVHSGGDPFSSKSEPIFTSNLPTPSLQNASFAYTQLSNDGGDILLAFLPELKSLMGFKYSHPSFSLVQVASLPIENSKMKVTHLGEDHAMLYDPITLDFEIVRVASNGTGVELQHVRKNNLIRGHNCLKDSAASCVATDGCAWCASTKTCHNYDLAKGGYCDGHVCEAPAILDKLAAEKFDSKDCGDKSTDPNQITIDHDESLPGNMRLPSSYRKDESETDVSPSHPSLDNELGDEKEALKNENEVIVEHNKAAMGRVYVPPSPGVAGPCMDGGYDATKGEEKVNAAWKMNKADGSDVAVHTLSPAGDSVRANDTNCVRSKPKLASQNANTQFHPSQGSAPLSTDSFSPQSVTTMHEEDLMNLDRTPHSDLKAQDMSLSTKSPSSELSSPSGDSETAFRPHEPERAPKEPTLKISAALPMVSQPMGAAEGVQISEMSLMNMGLRTLGLAGSYAHDGGNDGNSRFSFHSAMANSANPTPGMPKTIEQNAAVDAVLDRGTVSEEMPTVPKELDSTVALPSDSRSRPAKTVLHSLTPEAEPLVRV